ncbi:lysosomal acid lipase/cholesteryl ester hydrolase isoform X1 [Struthio camelus]|uniref:lysosomal acid lipase/cholesteryl ester hydrolase isoform X1 n=1 Tax=Struthio camelus TaxID=8801 RepID=UPI00360427D5
MMWLFVTIACLMCSTEKSEGLIGMTDASPEAFMDVGEIVRYHGYPYEEHEVVTDDGYYLIVQRIPHGRDNLGSTTTSHEAESQGSSMFCPTPKTVVLLQHGLMLEGSNWVINLPNSSLGFILADAGYDVWIGNSRGNSWSRKHKEFAFHQEEYSAYSFHEMAMYDLPATINYILQKTGQEQLYYVAFSQGTTTGFIAFSSIPELDRKIKMFFALAPITTNSNVKSPLVKVFDLPEALIKLILGRTVIFGRGKILQQVTSHLCSYSIFKSFCSLVLYLSGGFTNNLNVSRIDVYLSHYPDSTSLKTMLHWRQAEQAQLLQPFFRGELLQPSNHLGSPPLDSLQECHVSLVLGSPELDTGLQLYLTGDFKYYDYGKDNMLHYNQTTPPFYELENMKAPLAAWYGGKDWISAPEDVNITLSRITNVAYKKYIPEFVHLDFLWGMKAYEEVYREILELMEQKL